MARAKAKKRPHRVTRARPIEKRTAKPKPTESAAQAVERSWKDYWTRRTQLEDAVARVRSAHEALNDARQRERRCRAEFDQVKRSLTRLLDVEPAGPTARASATRQPDLMVVRSDGDASPHDAATEPQFTFAGEAGAETDAGAPPEAESGPDEAVTEVPGEK